jgi:outer membrane protein insertion porin family
MYRCAAVLALLGIGAIGRAEYVLESPLVAKVELRTADSVTDPSMLRLKTRSGEPYDAALIERDLRALYATGRYSDIKVATEEHEDGKLVIFEVTEAPRVLLRKVQVVPESAAKIELPPGTPIDEPRAFQFASQLRKKLSDEGHIAVQVEPRLEPVDAASADLYLHVNLGEQVRVNEVNLIGDTGLDPKQLKKSLRALKSKRVIPAIPGVWNGWTKRPLFSHGGAQSDIVNVQSFLLSRGYFDARVRMDGLDWDERGVDVNLAVNAGPRYEVNRWEVSGAEVPAITRLVNGTFDAKDFCQCLFDLRRDAEKAGVLDFNVRARLETLETGTNLLATVEWGRRRYVNRIDFTGNHKFSDSVIRGNLLLEEAAPLDSTLLRKSLHRLNRSRMFEPLDERSVSLSEASESGMTNVTVNLKERKAGSWFFSGPVGPMSVAGPLQFMLASRLPSWGRGLLNLSTYYASASLMSGIMPFPNLLGQRRNVVTPILALHRPFTPGLGWKSGFVLSPQLDYKVSALQYGATQVMERFLPWLSASESASPLLTVTVERPGGDALMVCEPPGPRLKWLRMGAATALQLAGAVTMF